MSLCYFIDYICRYKWPTSRPLSHNIHGFDLFKAGQHTIAEPIAPSVPGESIMVTAREYSPCEKTIREWVFSTKFVQTWILNIAPTTRWSAPNNILAVAEMNEIRYIHVILTYPRWLYEAQRMSTPFALSTRLADYSTKRRPDDSGS